MLAKLNVSNELVSVVAPDSAKGKLKDLGEEASHGCHAILEVSNIWRFESFTMSPRRHLELVVLTPSFWQGCRQQLGAPVGI